MYPTGPETYDTSTAKFTISLPCKFPFDFGGLKFDKCTNAVVLNDKINKSHESFYWCATHLDSELKMIGWSHCCFDKSGKCQTQNNVMKFGGQILLIAGSFLLPILIKILFWMFSK